MCLFLLASRRWTDASVARTVHAFMHQLVFLPGAGGSASFWKPVANKLTDASRAVACFDGEERGVWRTGFTYRTLAGHPELGEETFCVEKNLGSGEVQVALTSWSRPGLWMVRVGSPLARQLQRTVNEGALVRLAAIARAR